MNGSGVVPARPILVKVENILELQGWSGHDQDKNI